MECHHDTFSWVAPGGSRHHRAKISYPRKSVKNSELGKWELRHPHLPVHEK